MAVQKVKPEFGRILRQQDSGLLLKPLLSSYLSAGVQPEFAVEFRRKGQRKPDGWFHPSTHPLWTERQLYYYLTDPEGLRSEALGEVGMMSVTVGTVLHTFLQAVVVDMGVVAPDDVERKLSDPETKARGAIDGIVRIGDTVAVWDYKTAHPVALSKLQDLDLEAWSAKYPYYYAQQQEYMRMSGIPLAIVTMMGTASPWEQREFHIPYNPEFAEGIAAKYRRVLSYVADGTPPPEACCMPGDAVSKSCVARVPCPQGASDTVKVNIGAFS
jgi:hypothetical protein